MCVCVCVWGGGGRCMASVTLQKIPALQCDGTVSTHSCPQVQALRAVGGQGGGVGSELVPTLAEALECARGRARLLVELKDEDIADKVVRRRQTVTIGRGGSRVLSVLVLVAFLVLLFESVPSR